MPLKEIPYQDIRINPMTAFGDDWAALATGGEGDSNAMTIAWGELGSLWDRVHQHGCIPVATVFVRPQRYTHEFMDREDTFSISFLGPEHKRALGYLGSHSGRDGDKYGPAGLTPIYDDGTTYFAEARLVLVCRKLYADVLKEQGFVDRAIMERNYPERDFHTVYVGEIVKALAQAQG